MCDGGLATSGNPALFAQFGHRDRAAEFLVRQHHLLIPTTAATLHTAHRQRRLTTMAPTKKSPSASKTRSSSSSVSLKKVKGENFYRNAKQVARAKMLTGGKAVRDKDGKVIQAAAFQKGEDETAPGRVQPDRRWFGACRNGENESMPA